MWASAPTGSANTQHKRYTQGAGYEIIIHTDFQNIIRGGAGGCGGLFRRAGLPVFLRPINTTLVYASVEEQTIEISGYLVREEETFHSDAATLGHSLSEGERVGKNPDPWPPPIPTAAR